MITRNSTSRYIGDGVYASFDGEYVWLETDRAGMIHRIAIDSDVLHGLTQYVTDIKAGKVRVPVRDDADGS